MANQSKSIENIEITRFSVLRSTTPKSVTNLSEVLEDIKSDKYKQKILDIRKHENPTKCPAKNWLPVFTPTGTFSHRSIAGLEIYNGIVCLDIDNISNPYDAKLKCSKIPWVTAAFTTPSGNGIKVMIQTNSTIEQYKETELEISQIFEEITGLKRDNHCKDIARIQFVSWDPAIYINTNPMVFETPSLITKSK